jgi:hypothetical protein
MPFPARFPWLPALAILAILTFSAALCLCYWLVWTPIERYYLGAYLKCALPGIDRGSSAEVRWLYKIGPHGKRELALDGDVVPVSSGGERRIPLELSPGARQAGWTGLMQAPGEWLQTATLKAVLEEQFYAGESIWRMLLMPLFMGAAMFFFLLAGFSMLPSRPQYEPWEMERFDWGRPPASLLQRWRTRTKEVGKIGFRLQGLAKQRMPEIRLESTPPAPATVPADLLKKPTVPVLPLFGSTTGSTMVPPNGKTKEGFRSEETKAIE